MVQRLFVEYWSHVFLVALAFIAVLAILWRKGRPQIVHRQIASRNCRVWAWLSTSIIAVAIAHFAFYLVMPNYADYGEPVIPLLAANFLYGGSVYADWHAGHAVVGSNYGPYTFIIHSLALALAPSIAVSKMVGILFAVAALYAFFFAVRGRVPRSAFALCAAMIVLSSFNLHYWFWSRPDSILICLVALGALLMEKERRSRLLIWLGLLAGVATNLKLFGSIYLIPLALVCVVTQKWPELIRSGSLGALLFLFSVALPFGFDSIDLEPYLSNILLMPNQGFDTVGFRNALLYGIVIVALPCIVAVRYRFWLSTDTIVLTAGTVVVTVLVAVLAGKPGGGPPYMLPLIPLALYSAALIWSRLPEGEQATVVELQRVILIGAFVAALPIWAYSWFQMGKQIPNWESRLERAAELRGLFAKYTEAEMGHADGKEAAEDGFLRVEKAFLGQVARFDYVNYADQRAAGLPVAVLYPLFDNCSVPSWILARSGAKFTGNGYGKPLFDAGIHLRLISNYRLTAVGKYYEVWTCKDVHRVTRWPS
ncbi:hypothetical protein [Sinorhizobium fredii]|uniref:hypothetical protein n=1 Tax=Rhizobium fredii TaxID=380 RepID=UPI00351481E3